MSAGDPRSGQLAFEDQAGGRAAGEQTAVAVGDAAFGGAETAAPAQHDALRADHAGLRRDRPNERNLELQRRLAATLFQRRPDREPHAAIKQRRREPAVHGAGRVEVASLGFAVTTTRPSDTSVTS